MKKLWTLIASTMLVASVAFAQDDFDPEYTDQAEEQVAEQAEEQAEEQPAEQEQVAESADEAEQANAAEEPAPAKPAPAPYQANAQEPEQTNTEADDYAQENAQRKINPFGFGFRFAFDYGRMFGFKEDLDNDSDIDGNPSGIGYEGGIMGRIQMIPNLYFTPEVNFAYISTEHEYMSRKRKYNSMDLEIPLLMRGVIADRFYITGGAQFNLTLKSEAKIDPVENATLNIKVASNEKIEQSSFAFGIVAGAGINIVAGLFFDFRYYMGITELYPDVKTLDDLEFATGDYSLVDMSGARMMKFKVGISYWII